MPSGKEDGVTTDSGARQFPEGIPDLIEIARDMTILDIGPDVEGWVRWANDAGLNPLYIGFAQARPGVVFSTEPPKDTNEPRCSARSFTYAEAFHTAGDAGNMDLPSDDVTQEVIGGYIGQAAAAEFFSFIKVQDELPDINDILTNPETAKLPKPERLDAQYVAAQMLVHHADNSNAETLFRYAVRLNKELQASVAKQLVDKTRSGVLANSATLAKWISENPALIAASLAS